MDAVIHLRSVVSVLGRFPALAGVDLDVEAGEIVLVSGPNGAGKSTLLRVCGGLVVPVSGEAEVLGFALPARRRALRRRVGYLGHANGLYDDLSVRENVEFWAGLAGPGALDAAAALGRLQVDARLATVAAAHLSAGQRRRVALAALVARRPQLWLLDEPHVGLDAAGRDLLDGLVVEAAGAGATVLIVAHDVERLSGVATRHVTLVGGTVATDTATSQLRSPRDAAGLGPRSPDNTGLGPRSPNVTGPADVA